MARIWDILPPKRKRKLKPAEKKERRANVSWFFFLAVVAAFFIVFFGASKIPLSSEDNSTLPVTSSPSAKTSRSPTQNQSRPTIKLLNGTGRVEETQKVKDALKNAGFNLTITENALNVYKETIIYYQPQFETNARNLATALASYNPKIQKFTQETQYDIVIVIGTQ